MTALNCFVTPNAVHFATDGAAYLTDGSPCGQNQKVAILAHLPAIIAVRGPIALAQIVAANAAPLFCTFDELVAAAPEHLRAPTPPTSKTWRPAGSGR